MLCEICLLTMLGTFSAFEQDLHQTSRFVELGFKETNPFLGEHPTGKTLNQQEMLLKLLLFALQARPWRATL